METCSSSPTRRATTMWWRPNFQGGGGAAPFSMGTALPFPDIAERLGKPGALSHLAALGSGRGDLGLWYLFTLLHSEVAVELPRLLDGTFDEVLGHRYSLVIAAWIWRARSPIVPRSTVRPFCWSRCSSTRCDSPIIQRR